MKTQKKSALEGDTALTITVDKTVKAKFKAAAALRGLKLTEALAIALTEYADRALEDSLKVPPRSQK